MWAAPVRLVVTVFLLIAISPPEIGTAQDYNHQACAELSRDRSEVLAQMEICNRVIAAESNNCAAANIRAWLLAFQGNYQAALLQTGSGKHSDELLSAVIKLIAGSFEEALALLDPAKDGMPSVERPLLRLVGLTGLGRHQEALADIQKYPGSAWIRLVHGVLLFKTGLVTASERQVVGGALWAAQNDTVQMTLLYRPIRKEIKEAITHFGMDPNKPDSIYRHIEKFLHDEAAAHPEIGHSHPYRMNIKGDPANLKKLTTSFMLFLQDLGVEDASTMTATPMEAPTKASREPDNKVEPVVSSCTKRDILGFSLGMPIDEVGTQSAKFALDKNNRKEPVVNCGAADACRIQWVGGNPNTFEALKFNFSTDAKPVIKSIEYSFDNGNPDGLLGYFETTFCFRDEYKARDSFQSIDWIKAWSRQDGIVGILARTGTIASNRPALRFVLIDKATSEADAERSKVKALQENPPPKL